MMMKTLKIAGIVLIILVGLTYILSIIRTTTITEKEIEITKDSSLLVTKKHSERIYYGGHALGWGGGHPKNKIQFKYNKIPYEHTTPFILIVLKLFKGDFYFVYFDRETNFEKIVYRFYKTDKDGNTKEIKAKEFPKHLAVQNSWLDKKNRLLLKEMDIEGEFSNSLTAKLWVRIEANILYYEQKYGAPVDIIRRYKEKYITVE